MEMMLFKKKKDLINLFWKYKGMQIQNGLVVSLAHSLTFHHGINSPSYRIKDKQTYFKFSN